MTYLQPAQLDDALSALVRQPELRIAAGCTDLFPATQAPGLTGPVLDITRIDGLRGISRTPGGWRIGGATTWRDVIGADLPAAFDMLKAAAREVGSPQIQAAGTIAGNLCNASPAADGVPPLLALDAEVELVSASGSRRLPLGAFLSGPRATQLQTGELLTAITLPEAATRGVSVFHKLGARRYLVISIAMVALRLDLSPDASTVTDLAIAVGACSPVARRMDTAEAALIGAPLSELPYALPKGIIADALDPIGDVRGSADFRREAGETLVRRALGEAATLGAKS